MSTRSTLTTTTSSQTPLPQHVQIQSHTSNTQLGGVPRTITQNPPNVSHVPRPIGMQHQHPQQQTPLILTRSIQPPYTPTPMPAPTSTSSFARGPSNPPPAPALVIFNSTGMQTPPMPIQQPATNNSAASRETVDFSARGPTIPPLSSGYRASSGTQQQRHAINK